MKAKQKPAMALEKSNGGVPVIFDPSETKGRLSEISAIKDHAKRMKDWPLLDRAVEAEIEEILTFVDWWGQAVTVGQSPGRNGSKSSRERGTISLKEAEAQTEIRNQQVSQWRKKRKDPEKWAFDIKTAARRRCVEDAANTTATKWTGDPESYTPARYIEAVRLVLCGIDLDPATDQFAQQTVKATRWFTAKDDGLKQLWFGSVFLNPPYSFPTIEHFVFKLLRALGAGHVIRAILLTNNNTDTKWWQKAAAVSNGVCFTAGRINFYKPDGSVSQPTNGQTFFYFGQEPLQFVEIFSEFGLVMNAAYRGQP